MKTLVLLLACLAVSTAFGDLKSDWQKKFERLSAIEKAKDSKGLDKWCADNCATDFRFVVGSGRPFFLKDWLAMEKQHLAESHGGPDAVVHIDDLEMEKAEAILRISARKVVAKTLSKGKADSNAGTSYFRAKLAKRNGKWLLEEIRSFANK